MSFTVDYNKARLANPGLSVDEFRKRQTTPGTMQVPLPSIQPQVASTQIPQNPQVDYQSKLDNSLTKMGIDGFRAQQLIQNPVFKKSLYEMSLNQNELSNNPEYQSLVSKDKQRTDLGNKMGQMQMNAPNALLALEDALRTKQDVGNQALGESQLFKDAGLSNITNLQQSLGQNLQDMQARYGSFTNVLSRVSQSLANEYSGVLSSYKTLTDEYKDQYASLNDTLDKIAQHEEAMSLAEKEAQLQQDVLKFKSNLDNESNKYQPVQDLIVPGQMWSFNKVTGQYTLSKVDANGNLTQGVPSGGTPGSSPTATGGGYAQNSPAGGWRTDRNNNPIASSLSLLPDGTINKEDKFNKEWMGALDAAGVKYSVEQGANFGNRATIKFDTPEDGIKGAKVLMGTSAFSWYKNHTGKDELASVNSAADFITLPEDQKNAIIAKIYKNEVGNGSLMASTQSVAQAPSILNQQNVVASTGNQGVRPAEFTEADVRELAVRMGGDYKEPKKVEQLLYQFRQTGAVPEELIQFMKWGRPLSATELSKVGQMDGAGNLLTTLESLLSEIPSYDATDLQSSIEAKAKGLYLETQAKWTGWPPEAAAYLDTTGGMSSMFIRALGEVGSLSDGDIRRAKALIPQISDPTGVRAKKIDNLHKLFNAIQSGYSKNKTIPQAVLETLDSIDAEGGVSGIEYKGGGRAEAISILNANGYPVTEENINAIINSK